jgi:long-chain acyl-CoA synthetase
MIHNGKWIPFEFSQFCHKKERERYYLVHELFKTSDQKLMFPGALLHRGACLFTESIALISKDREITYQELYNRAANLSNLLSARGIKPGDRILLFVENSLYFYVAYFGIWQLGAVVVPLNIFLLERELNHIVGDARPAMIVTHEHKVALFKGENLPPILTEQDINLEGEVQRDGLVECPMHEPKSDELALLLYTSGTTGLPKGVMLSSRNIMTNVAQMLARVPLCEPQRLFCILPLFHCFAQNICIWLAFFSGSSVIVVSKIERRALLDGLKHKPTIFLGVPALYGLLTLLKTAPLDHVEYFISGGDALPDKIRAGFEAVYRRKLCNGYGLTETSPFLAAELDDVADLTNCVGRPALGIECSLRNEYGNEVARTDIGTLWVRGANVMLGYYNSPEKTAADLIDGWFCTGDYARFNDEGKLFICGRNKDLISNKGLKIYPQEVENIISDHMAVLYVGVIGALDEMHNEVPVAYVQLFPGKQHEVVERELRELCTKNLAAYKVPRSFIFIHDMPLTATNKVDKKVLRVFWQKENEGKRG